MVRRSVPAGIDETLAALEDPATQRRIDRLLNLPEVQEAARELGEGLTTGVLDGLGDEARMAKTQQLSADYVAALTRAVGQGLRDDISPAVVDTTERAVARALDSALSPSARQGAAKLVEALTRRTVTTLSAGLREDLGPATQAVLEDNVGPAIQRVLEDNVGPALRSTIEKDVAPALREAIDAELVPAAGRLSREVSREAVLGMVDALEVVETDPHYAGFRARIEQRVAAVVDQGIRASELVAWLLGLLVLILAVVLIRSMMTRRHLEAERARSERMLVGILHVLKKTRDVRVDQVIDEVRDHDPELARASPLNALIDRVIAATRDLFDGKSDPPPPKS